MKKTFRIRIDDEEMTITVERHGNELLVERDGESHRVVVVPADQAIEPSARNPEARVVSEAPVPAPESESDDHQTSVRATTPTAAPRAVGGVTGGVPAPITGTIKEVLVSSGESISQGERVMMMEAMKMDIEIVAPASGKVAQVFVKAGDSVKENQPLFRIE